MAGRTPRAMRAHSRDVSAALPSRPRDREVLNAAATVFARNGYASATVQDVADELGILKGSLYYYIRAKEDLLFRLLLEVHENGEAILAEVASRDDLTPLALLQEYVRAQTAYNVDNMVRISVYYNDLGQLSEPRRAEVLERRRRHEDFVIQLVAEAQRTGEADPARDPKLMTYSIFAAIIWPYRWYRRPGRYAPEQIVDACVDFVMHGVAPLRDGGA